MGDGFLSRAADRGRPRTLPQKGGEGGWTIAGPERGTSVVDAAPILSDKVLGCILVFETNSFAAGAIDRHKFWKFRKNIENLPILANRAKERKSHSKEET
jgi:hypothetical protein